MVSVTQREVDVSSVDCGSTHVSLLQERQHLGNVVESEDTMGGPLVPVELEDR